VSDDKGPKFNALLDVTQVPVEPAAPPLLIIAKVLCYICGAEKARLAGRSLVERKDAVIDRVGIRNYPGDRPWSLFSGQIPPHPHPLLMVVDIARDDGKTPMGEVLFPDSPWWPIDDE
jgi:hypothetical protein